MTTSPTSPTEPNSKYQWYLTGLVTWVVPFGLQTVLFPWLIAVQLQESADRLGIAQMTMQLPGLFFILIGGVLADRVDPRRILMTAHLLAAIPPLGIAFLLAGDQLSYNWLILYALMIGTINAFVMPARDGMLNQVAGSNLQRAVTIVMGLTFGAQLIGFVLASAADVTGAVPLLIFQGAIFLLGMLAVQRLASLPIAARQGTHESSNHLERLTNSLKVVWHSPAMRPAMLMLFTISVFYGGTFVVINPLIVRDIYGGSAFEISLSYSCFVIGTVAATLIMLSVGGLKNQGRALMLAVIGGGLVLSASYLAPPFWVYLAVLFGWGLCGGVAMSMGRTIMQEAAPEHMRARIMAVFSLANTGGMPLGALMLGFLAAEVGTLVSILAVVSAVWVMALLIWSFSGLSAVALGHGRD